MAMSVSSPWFHTRWKLVSLSLSLLFITGATAIDELSGNSLSFAQEENQFISMAKKVGLRFVDGKDREGAEDLGNDEEFLLDLFESKNLHKMAQIVGQMNHVFTHQPNGDLTEQSTEEPEMSTHKLPMKSHTHKDDSPTELVMVNNVAEPIYWESPDILTEEATTSIPEYLTETLYYFEKDQTNLSRPFARTPRTPKSLEPDNNSSHKSRKILQVFEDPQDEQDHMMMMLHNAVAMVELEDVLQNLRPIPFNDHGNRVVLKTQQTRRPPVQTPAPDVATRKVIKKPRKQPGRLRSKLRRPRPTQIPTQNPTFVLPGSSQPLTTLAPRSQNDLTSRFTPRPAPRFNTEQPNTLQRKNVSPKKVFPVQDFFPESRQSQANAAFTPQISSLPPSLSPTPATPTTPRPRQQNRFAVTQPTRSEINTLAARNSRPIQQPKFVQVQRPVQQTPQPIRGPGASPPPSRIQARLPEPSLDSNRLSSQAESAASSRQGKQFSNEVQNGPSLTEIPKTSFSCRNQAFPGLYADPEADCQVFYMCHGNGRQNGFLCPAGTLFDQRFLVCNWWHKVDCSRATSLYSINEGIYQ